MVKRILIPTTKGGSTPRKRFIKSRRRTPTPVKLFAVEDEVLNLPSLVFKRRYPNRAWVVPPVKIPLYWFDRVMVKKGLIVGIPPDIFVVDGRRFRVLAQDERIGRSYQYTRWLVYEEAAVPKGERP